MHETETVTSGLFYIEDSIFLENNLVWFWVQSFDSSVVSYNILSYSRFLFYQLSAPDLEKSA